MGTGCVNARVDVAFCARCGASKTLRPHLGQHTDVHISVGEDVRLRAAARYVFTLQPPVGYAHPPSQLRPDRILQDIDPIVRDGINLQELYSNNERAVDQLL